MREMYGAMDDIMELGVKRGIALGREEGRALVFYNRRREKKRQPPILAALTLASFLAFFACMIKSC